MPHERSRHLQKIIEKTLSFSPIVGIFGHRQVGKTTLTRLLAKKYITFDDRISLDSSLADPAIFLQDHAAHPLVIDECQLSPPLFPAMKEWVRQHPKPGQLLITGSVRFSSRKQIRESLTGRIISWEMLPMDLSEIHHEKLPDALLRILTSNSVEVALKTPKYFNNAEFARSLSHGGLPGLFSIRDSRVRIQKFETHLETILERDLRLLIQTTLSYKSLHFLLEELAKGQGEPLEIASLSRSTRVSPITLKKILNAFESMFLIRTIHSEGSERKPVIFMEDQGEASYLLNDRTNELRDITRFLYSQLRVQYQYRPEKQVTCFQFRNRGGTHVPLCYRSPNHVLGIIPMLEQNPNHHMLTTARSFINQNKNAKILFIHLGKNDVVISKTIRAMPVGKLLGC